MTETRARMLTTALDTADVVAVATAAATAGLTTYRALNTRPVETRIVLALAAAGIAACCADQITAQLRRPLRSRLGLTPWTHSYASIPVPTTEQLAQEVAADAAHRAAAAAASLDRSGGSLTQADNWTGTPDGTATCELPGSAHLLCVPSPAGEHGYVTRSFLLVRDGRQPAPVRSIGDLAALLDPADLDTDNLPTTEDGDPWAATVEQFGTEDLTPAAADTDETEDSDGLDQEPQARTGDSL
ncbi:hypothetical protein ACFVUN_34610 [Kitasatospora griseola]|uniref:hypothetical protein n=1 Tax=Kitasatospora griseola TaxID=2064 RepID=UPI0036D7E143